MVGLIIAMDVFYILTVLVELNKRLATRLFDDFAGSANWEVFPDVEPTLKKIKQAGIVLGVISNFDERLG